MTDFNNDDKALITREDMVETKNAKLFMILGWVFMMLSFVSLPIVFGSLGILFGHLTRKNGKEKEGKTLMIASGITMAASIILGAILFSMRSN